MLRDFNENHLVKTAYLSGLAWTSLLLASCSAGDDKDAGSDNAGAMTLNAASIDPHAAETGFLAQMQGDWTSDEDAKNTITIDKSSFQSFTDGALQDDVLIIFVDSCKTRVPDMESKTFVLAGKEKQTCYLLYSVSEDKLSYIESSRGRTSRFTRKNK